jgi:hypothetical protein
VTQRVGRQRGRQAEGDERQEEDANAEKAPAWTRYGPVVELAQHRKGLPAEATGVHRVAEERFSPLRKRVLLTEALAYLMFRAKPQWRNGRRDRLKICYPQGCAGSSPAWGTN